MQTKACPSCGEDVPLSAFRCRHCFHDFDEEPARKPLGPILAILGILAFMGVSLAACGGWMIIQPTDQVMTVNGETDSIVFTRRYRWGVQTESIPFSDVASLVHVVRNDGSYKVLAIRTDGGEIELAHEDRTQKSRVAYYAKVMGKDWTERDETTGFFKRAKDAQQEQ